MRDATPIAELADWLHQSSSTWKSMALLRAYFDESGTHGSTITAIGGYVATSDTWDLLEKAWREEIALFADMGLKSFHMSECISGTGQYERISFFHRHAHIKRMSEILRDADVQAIGVWVDNNDWAEMNEPELLAAFPKPYNLCFDHMVRFLREWSKSKVGGERVVPMFGYTLEYSPKTIELYGAETWYRDVLGAIAFDSPDYVLPLQTADFVAHQIRQDAHRVGYDDLTLENIGMTLALHNATLKNGTDMIRGYTSGGLKAAARRLRTSGKIL
jgi:hypothetical protein